MFRAICLSGHLPEIYPTIWLINNKDYWKDVGFRVLLLISFSFFFTRSLCQAPDHFTAWSNYHTLRSTSRIDIVGFDSFGGLYAVKEHIKSSSSKEMPYVLEHYNKNLILTKSLDLKIKDEGRKPFTEQVIQLNKRLYIIYSLRGQQNKKLLLYAKQLDPITLQPFQESTKLFEIDFADSPNIPHARFVFRFSADSSNVFVMRQLSQSGSSADYYSCVMLDSNLQLRWHKKVPLPYNGGKFRAENIKVNNEGNVFMLGSSNSMYDLITIRNNGDSVVRYPIRLKGYYLNSLQIEILGKDNLICGGFYSMTSSQGTCGTYFMSVDFGKGQIKSTHFAPLETRFILEGINGRDSKWNFNKGERGEAAELYRYTLDRLLIGDNGSTILIGEQRYRYSNTAYDYGIRGPGLASAASRVSRTPANFAQPVYVTNTSAMARNYHYVANDIIVVKLDSTGNINWSHKIRKSQNTLDDNGIYSSYLFANIGGKLFFLFNDDPDNLHSSGTQYPRDFDGSRSITTMVCLDMEGNLDRQTPYNVASKDVVLIPRMSKWISDRELILFGRKQDYLRLGRMTFK